MVITKTPFRISFVGGGSDLADFYEQYEGAVLSTSIDKYMYISTHVPFQKFIRAKYSKTETVNTTTELEHPIIKATLNQFNIKAPFEISSIADIPSGTGLGSSSSFTVGMLQNLHAFTKKEADKELLANEACNIEINILNEPIGKQDQYAAAYGGLKIYRFKSNGEVAIEPINLSASSFSELQDNLLMFYAGEQRSASGILADQKKNMQQADKVAILKDMVALVDELKNVLEQDNLLGFGNLLHQNWLLKQKLSTQISNTTINDIYNLGIKNGALGGKLLGAGGNGFLLFYCEADKQNQLRSALSNLQELNFNFDKDGSKIIFKD